MDLLQYSAQVIRRHRKELSGGPLVLAVSGGNDSLVLLHVMRRLQRELELKLHVASLDHGLRGAAGAGDVSFVGEQAQALGAGFTAGCATGVRSEAGARRARYDFLARTARQVGARMVVTAHHADDQVETLLLNLVRGSGLRGLTGMQVRAPLPGHPQLTLLRPFLEVPRSVLLAWGQDQGLEPREDASNDDQGMQRNRLRHDILPRLREINPRVDQSLLRLADSARLDHDLIRRQLDGAMRESSQRSGRRIRVARSTYAALHPALKRHLALEALRALGDCEVGAGHVTGLVSLADTGRTGQVYALPGPFQMRLEYDDLVFEHVSAEVDWPGPLLLTRDAIPVRWPGTTPLPPAPWQLVISRQRPDRPVPWPRLSLPPDAAISLDTRKAGDRFHPIELKGHSRTLKKWMISHQVPRAIRMHLPLLRVDDQVAAIFATSAAIPSSRFLASEADDSACFCEMQPTFGPSSPQCLQ